MENPRDGERLNRRFSMCGRFTLRATSKKLIEVLELPFVPEMVPRYNIAPTQPVGVVRATGRERGELRWGLVPSWSADLKRAASLINALSAKLHDRMPVILPPSDYGRWLDPNTQDPDELEPLLRPFPAERMTMVPVNPIVNNARNEVPECMEATGPPERG